MINGLPLPAMFIAPDMKCVKANGLAKAMYPNWRKGRMLDAVLTDVDLLDTIRQSIEDGGVHDCELITQETPRRIFQVRVNGKVRRNKKHRILLVFYEITDQRELDDVRAAFVANVSHELRSPLTTLLGAVQAVQGMQDRNSDQATRFLDIMQGEAERMRLLVNDLLILSDTEAKEHIMPSETVDLLPLLSHMQNGLGIQADKRNIELVVEVPESLPLLRADRKEIDQVLYNLTDNAVKYGRQDSRVLIKVAILNSSAKWPDGAISVMVQNWGDIIPQEKVSRLTERFFRLDDSRSRQMGGTGLGLAIVKHIINRHRGELQIDSDGEAGTRFTICLPVGSEDGAIS